MVLVTDKQYYIEPAMKEKLDLAIARYNDKRDSLFIIEGSEGDGKSTATIGWAYYIAHTIGKPFTVDNVFFDAEEMLKFAASTEGQIIVWDEAATAALASQWQRGIQQKLIQVLMMARKKCHFWFFVIPKFWKMQEYIVDRAIGMIHVYSPDLIKRGFFVYYKKEMKDWLYQRFVRDKKRSYKVGWAFKGKFFVTGFVIDEKQYEAKKDAAINKLFAEKPLRGNRNAGRQLEMFNRLKKKIADIPNMTEVEKAEYFELDKRTILSWRNGATVGENPTTSGQTLIPK